MGFRKTVGSTPWAGSTAYQSVPVVRSRGYNKGYSGCLRCGATREPGVNEFHAVWVADWAISPLCEPCWEETTPDERYNYCLELLRRGGGDPGTAEELTRIRAACE